MSLRKSIYEHLKTKKKYNTLELKYTVKCEEYDNKVVEVSILNRIHQVEKNALEETIRQRNEEIADLKKKLAMYKKANKKEKE